MRKISPQIRYAVERALARAEKEYKAEQTRMEAVGCISLQGVAWADECESLEEAVEILKGLER